MTDSKINLKRVGALACLMTALLLISFAPSPASAGAQHFEFEVPAGPLFVECLGEEIQGVFQGRGIFHVRESASGVLHVTENLQIGGLFVGLESGIEWTPHGANSFRANSQGEQLTLGFVETISLVAPGGAQNLLTKVRETLVVNANGVLTRDFFAVSFECP